MSDKQGRCNSELAQASTLEPCDMNAEASSTTSGIFCRKCAYDLRATAENRCPECGKTFDPQERRTYDLRPRRTALRKWVWRFSFLTLAIVVTLGGMIGW